MEDSFQGGYRCQAPMETEEVDLGRRDVTLLMLAMVNLRWAWDIQAEMFEGQMDVWLCISEESPDPEI